MAYHGLLSNWGTSLPKGWKFEFVPVVVPERESVLTARSFYAVSNADTNRLNDFMMAAFAAIQQQNKDPKLESTWVKILRDQRISGIEDAWRRVSEQQVLSSLEGLVKYKINATPTLVIDGRYVITPDNTNGDHSLFLQLANGMVSKAMIS
jgi:thiol:disulfide interchange protein DsbA